jgi:hypothetical protein
VHTGEKEGLWERIEKRYNEQRGDYPCRLNRALSSRWDKIRADVGKFLGCYARVLRENQSGLTDDDKVQLCEQSYDQFFCNDEIIIMKLLNFLHFVLCGQTSKAATLFAHEENKPFHFMHCWHKMRSEPKWQSIC